MQTFSRNTTDSGENRRTIRTKCQCALGMSGGGFRQTMVRSRFWSTTSLVTRGGAFYNPSNTALDTVVKFFGGPWGSTDKAERLYIPRAGALVLTSILAIPRSTE